MTGQHTTTTEATSILFVCTGNIARSPYLEHRLRQRLDGAERPGYSVGSAGTHAMLGHDMAPLIARALDGHGIDASGWAPRSLSADVVRSAALILTAEAAHVGDVVRLDPSATRRAFPLRQLARLLSVVPVSHVPVATSADAVTQLIAGAQAARGSAERAANGDDIPDPWQRSRRTYRRSIAGMDAALDVVADHLVGLSPHLWLRSTTDPERTA